MGVRSLGNALASFGYKFGTTGTEAVGSAAAFSASGGNIDGVAPGNGYKYHVFTANGALVTSGEPVQIDAIVVGKGGSAAPRHGGGGGGGGVAYISNRTISDGTHEIQFEGPGQVNFISGGVATIALKGGDGPFNGSGGAGGSGGGGGSPGGGPSAQGGGTASQPSQNPSQPYTTNYGNAGGSGGNQGGGGGGSGGAGGQGSGPSPGETVGAGGVAQPFPAFAGPLFPGMPSDWQTAVGPEGRYASGGVGAGRADSSFPSGKQGANGGGGGGAGQTGITNTGGGGGGGNDGPVGAGSGGPGIVIIRYAV